MKSLNIPAVLLFLIAAFISIDYGFAQHEPMEIGTVAYKTLAPVGSGDIRQPSSIRHVLVVVQPAQGRGYWVPVSRERYYDLSIDVKLRISKDYGLITGWEYNQTIYTGSSFRAGALE